MHQTAVTGYGKFKVKIAEKTVRKKAEKIPNAEGTTKKKGGLRKNKITHGVV